MDGPPYGPAPGINMNGAGETVLLQKRSWAPYSFREQAVMMYSLVISCNPEAVIALIS